jgi:hypothetical protein
MKKSHLQTAGKIKRLVKGAAVNRKSIKDGSDYLSYIDEESQRESANDGIQRSEAA